MSLLPYWFIRGTEADLVSESLSILPAESIWIINIQIERCWYFQFHLVNG